MKAIAAIVAFLSGLIVVSTALGWLISSITGRIGMDIGTILLVGTELSIFATPIFIISILLALPSSSRIPFEGRPFGEG